VLFLPSHYQPTVPLQYGPASPLVWSYRAPGDLALQDVLDNTTWVSGCICRASKAGRIDADYTQRAVATLRGVDASTYNNYERGRGKEPPTAIPLHLIERFCVLCQAPIDWLL